MSHTAIVTGASSGIGLAVARRLLADGYAVVLGGRDHDKLERRRAELNSDRTVTVAGDIGSAETADRLVDAAKSLGNRIDVLVNNAGIFDAAPFTSVTTDDFDNYVNVNLRGTWQVSQAVVRSMVEGRRAGSIVNIGTVLNQHAISGFPAAAPLVTKGGIQALTLALAAELAPRLIRVNMVAPGIIRTPLHPADQVDCLGGLALLNRVGEAAEIADAVVWLAKAEFVTGHILNVDGGFVTGRN